MILVATQSRVYGFEFSTGHGYEAEGLLSRRPSCLAAGLRPGAAAWCGTEDRGVFRSDDAGRSWFGAGLDGEHVTAIAVDPTSEGAIWAGTEPSAVWCSEGDGADWQRREGLLELPSSPEWSFPPRPDTHHVRWIACHPATPRRLWVAIEAGALVSTVDGGRSWQDRPPGGPYDTHELSIHPERPEHLHVAAGDGYFESADGGRTWVPFTEGLDVTYLRSVAIDPADPSLVVVSASSRPRTAYVAGHADGRLYRREGSGAWEPITRGWPEPPSTIAPLLAPDPLRGGFLAADERGVHRSEDGGRSWEAVAEYPAKVSGLRGLALTGQAPQ